VNFLSQGFEKLEHYRQTDRQRHKEMRLKYYHFAFADGKNNINLAMISGCAPKFPIK